MAQATVLIADDDAGLCRLLSIRCRNMGLGVRTAHDAMHALVVVHKVRPELVIMDIAMPAGNGLSACEMLLSDARLSGTPIIVYSGSSVDSDIARCSELGVDFVQKGPDSWPLLRDLIRERIPSMGPGAPEPRGLTSSPG